MPEYAENWREIARAIKEKAGWCCEACHHPHDPAAGYTLTVHHIDGNSLNDKPWNLAALCQRCHLWAASKVRLNQLLFPLLEKDHWLALHIEGYLSRREAS